MAPIKLRRLRSNEQIRNLFGQTQVSAKNMVMPYFVIEGKNKREPVKSMPGIYRLSSDNLIRDIREIKDLGINAILLFGIAQKKGALGTESYSKTGIAQKAIKEIRKQIKDIIIITDVCLCGYTDHGHCGIVKKSNIKNQKSKTQTKIKNFYIDNDETLKILAKIALSHAQAGVDFVAPSAMMDGQVSAIRDALDNNGFKNTGILAYSAKYASTFYGPFREALDSTPQFGGRKTYQMDYRNSDEALREVQQDIDEGADIVMVKPALSYLDIIYRVKQKFNVPVAAYNVSGEYSMVKSAAKEALANEKEIILEILTSIKRAGADLIITYHAKEAASWLMANSV
ncbi:MAG: porphobilinogen synthase [Candidatus Omnitrophota bacterium]|nr:porphobilinogen synthase [Candidatus Omnitrophota bacterium]